MIMITYKITEGESKPQFVMLDEVEKAHKENRKLGSMDKVELKTLFNTFFRGSS